MHYMQISKSGTYRFRVRVPKDATHFFQRKELNWSLYTASLPKAQVKALLLYNRFQELIELIRGHMLTDEQIQELVDEYIYIAMKVEDDIHIARKVPYKDKDLDVFLHEQQLQLSEEKLFEANLESVYKAAEMLLETLGFTLDVNDTQHGRFMLKLLQAEKKINQITLDRKHGNWVDVRKPDKLDMTMQPVTSGFTMEQALVLYGKSLNKDVKDVKDRLNFLNNVFIELIGKDTDAASVDIEVLLDIRELLSLFPRRNKEPYSKMKLSEIVALVKGVEDISMEDVIVPRTVNKYIDWLSAVFVFANKHGKIPRNPATGLKVKIDLAENEEREPFTDQELLQISNLLPLDDRKTIVNILYFTGMRLSEVFKAKLTQVDGVFVFDLTAKKDGDGKPIKLKTKKAYRVIPLHQKLIDEDVPKLFERIQEKYNSSYMSSWFNAKLLRPNITREKTKVLYSLRHNFATGLKNQKVQESLVAELMGHEQSTMSYKRYAADYDIAILKEAIYTLDFEIL